MKKSLFAAWMALLSTAALASPTTYVIDNSHTYPRFEYNHLGFSTQSHRFTKTTGTVVLDKANKTGSIDVHIDAKSVDTGNAIFNEHIQAEPFFDTARHADITFKSTKLTFDGDRLTAAQGELTIKGITRPVTLNVTSFHCMPHPMVKKEDCGANALTQVKRSDFNMSKNVPYVSDEVTIALAIEAIAQD